MSWIYAGVIALTNGSKAVAGTGTAWAGDVLEGDQLNTPTGPYEVESVASNGSLQLVRAYAGPTVSNQTYSIVPTQGRLVPFARQLSTLLTSLGQLKDAYQAGDLAEVADLVDKIDAATLALGTGATKIGLKLPGSTAVQRTVASRALDLISALDHTSAQAAVDAAGTNGAVIIPASYPGTEQLRNDYNIPLLDLRNQQLGIHSVIAPQYPASGYPFGHDLVLRARASADTYIEHFHVEAVTTQSLVVGWNYNVPISGVTCGNRRFPAGSGGGGAEMFSPIAQIVLGRETANEEQLNGHQGQWRYVDATHLDLLCTKTHSGVTDLDQGGSTLLASHDLYICSNQVKPLQNTTYDAPLRLKDQGGRLIAKIPTNIDNALPHSAWQWGCFQIGMFGTTRDLRYQHALSTSRVIWRDAAGVNEILTLDNFGKVAARGGLAAGVSSLVPSGVLGEIQIGRMDVAPTSPTDGYFAWLNSSHPFNLASTAGSVAVMGRNTANAAVYLVTQNAVRAAVNANGVQVINGFGCNGKAPQVARGVSASNASDLASAIALVNQLRAALIDNGICVAS